MAPRLSSPAASVGRLVRARRSGAKPEERAASTGVRDQLRATVGGRADDLAVDQVELICSRFPRPSREVLATAPPWRRLLHLVHPDYYWAQSTRPAPAADSPEDAVATALLDWLLIGAEEGLRPSVLFNPGWYAEQLEARDLAAVAPGADPLCDFVVRGWEEGISPTPLFDVDFYRAAYADVPNGAAPKVLRHFVMEGCRDPRKRPGPVAMSRFVAMGAPRRPIGRPMLLDAFLREGRLVRPAPDEHVRKALARTAILTTPQVRDLVAKAAAIEPAVLLDTGGHTYGLAPDHHLFTHLVHQAEEIRTSLPAPHMDAVVVTSGTGNGDVAHGLVRDLVRTGATVLVVTTDGPTDPDQAASWEPATAHVDLHSYVGRAPAAQRDHLLLDVLRGTTPEHIVNVESAHCWSMFEQYGKQLATWSSLTSYLFDSGHVPEDGSHVGHLEACFRYLSRAAVVEEELRERLVRRYCLHGPLADRLRTVDPGGDGAAAVLGLGKEQA